MKPALPPAAPPALRPEPPQVGVVPTEDVRRAYRQMLFEAQGAEQYVSAVIAALY